MADTRDNRGRASQTTDTPPAPAAPAAATQPAVPNRNTAAPTPTGSPLSYEEKQARLTSEGGERTLRDPEPDRGDTAGGDLTKDSQRVDLHNPTPARRVIYDGINQDGRSQKAITVEAGQTKRGVVLHKKTIDELRARTRPRGKEKSDLHVLAEGQNYDDGK